MVAAADEGGAFVSPVLETTGLCKAFGGVVAAADIDVRLEKGEIVGVIGANGAGKTSFVNMVTGYIRPDRGSIRLMGRDITGLGPREVTALGVARSFQIPQLFDDLTVGDNLLIALGIAPGRPLSPWRPLAEPTMLEAVRVLLERYTLAEYAPLKAVLLPQGVRKLLDIAMAMASDPVLVLLDEPTSGVSAEEKFPLMDRLVRALEVQKATVLFVEHDMEIVERYAQRVLAFVDGRIVADGPPRTVFADPAVRAGILGRPVEAPTAGAVR